jgi:hypothetical protein
LSLPLIASSLGIKRKTFNNGNGKHADNALHLTGHALGKQTVPCQQQAFLAPIIHSGVNFQRYGPSVAFQDSIVLPSPSATQQTDFRGYTPAMLGFNITNPAVGQKRSSGSEQHVGSLQDHAMAFSKLQSQQQPRSQLRSDQPSSEGCTGQFTVNRTFGQEQTAQYSFLCSPEQDSVPFYAGKGTEVLAK